MFCSIPMLGRVRPLMSNAPPFTRLFAGILQRHKGCAAHAQFAAALHGAVTSVKLV
jgi:hypothetical protein